MTTYLKAIVAFLAPFFTEIAVQLEQEVLDPVGLARAAAHGLIVSLLVYAVPNYTQAGSVHVPVELKVEPDLRVE